MGMFDHLKKSLSKFTGAASEDATLKEAKPAVSPPKAAPPPPAPPKVASKPAKFEIVQDDEDDLLDDELKAELEALEKEAPPELKPVVKAAPPPRAPAAEAPKPAAGPPAPTPSPAPAAREPASTARAPRPAAPAPKSSPPPAAVGTKSIEIEKIDDLLWDLELSLLESDVALPVVEAIKETLKANLRNVRVSSPDEVPRAVENALRAALLAALSVEPIDFDGWVLDKTMAKKPVVIMFVGVNGTGKTTSIGRIAYRLKENGYTSVMAAGDTFRAGAIQQLERHAEKVGVTLIKTQAGGDPAAVAYDAIEHAKGRMKDVVLLDTAGRMQTNSNLMDEMKKIKRVAKPDMIVFVGDSLAGNDAIEQATQFDKAVGIDAVILTKVDTDAKGGAALSIAKAVGKPILFLGVGQEYGDIVPYDPQWMVDRIFES